MNSSSILHMGGIMLQSKGNEVQWEHMVAVYKQSIEHLSPWKTTRDKGNRDVVV